MAVHCLLKNYAAQLRWTKKWPWKRPFSSSLSLLLQNAGMPLGYINELVNMQNYFRLPRVQAGCPCCPLNGVKDETLSRLCKCKNWKEVSL